MGNDHSKQIRKAQKRNERFGENLVSEQKRNFHRDYEIVEQIGEGSISNIYKIRKRRSAEGGSSRESYVKRSWHFNFPREKSHYNVGSSEAPLQSFALKEIDLHVINSEHVRELYNELALLKTLDHPNIIKAYETYRSKRNSISIVMELCTGGDLYSRHPYTERMAANITGKLLSAVAYLHQRNIIHRDLKFENIMFENSTPSAEIKLIDFGLSKKFRSKRHIFTQRVGTTYTMAPQVLQGVYTSQADMWSVGVITFMLLSGEKPFWAPTKARLTDKIMRGKAKFGPAWKYISKEGRSFVKSLLQVDPTIRLTAEEALRAPWLEKEFKLSDRRPPDSVMDGVKGNLVRYEESGEFRKLVLNVIARKSTTEEIFELRKAFDQFDSDNDGTISVDEFKEVLAQHQYSDMELESMFQSIDVNKNGVILYTEFLAATLEAQGHIEEHRVAEAFDLLDSDDTGYISKENLRSVVGENCDDAHVDNLIAEMDLDGTGQISYSEFLQAFTSQKNEEIEELYTVHTLGNDSSSESDELLTADSPIPGGKHFVCDSSCRRK